jgi:hypothetical protein
MMQRHWRQFCLLTKIGFGEEIRSRQHLVTTHRVDHKNDPEKVKLREKVKKEKKKIIKEKGLLLLTVSTIKTSKRLNNEGKKQTIRKSITHRVDHKNV